MLTRLEVEGFRGIKKADVPLTQLTVLIGHNNSGKTTLLEALYLRDGAAVGELHHLLHTARGGYCGLTGLRSTFDERAHFAFHDPEARGGGVALGVEYNTPPTEWDREAEILTYLDRIEGTARFGDGVFTVNRQGGGVGQKVGGGHVPGVQKVVDSAAGRSVVEITNGVGALLLRGDRARRSFVELLQQVDPNLRDVVLVPVEQGMNGQGVHPHAVYEEGTVPLQFMGDGVKRLIFIATCAAADGKVLLLEEPEHSHHPQSLRVLARLIWGIIERGVQVVLSTHSLALVNALNNAREEDPRLSVMYLERGADGVVEATSRDAASAALHMRMNEPEEEEE